ncbi:MAG: agmatinase [Dehalococcoidia bacterium]
MSRESEPYTPSNFLALPPEQSSLEGSRVVVLPVPYDSTTSSRSGTREGPRAIIEASAQLEDYDPELDSDVAQLGIYTSEALEPHVGDPAAMIERVARATLGYAQQSKLVALLGGEHSISVGAVRAWRSLYPRLTVLYLDAHADLRDVYWGTRWGHASTARRILDLGPLVEVGVRSLSEEEQEFIRREGLPVFFWSETGGPELDLDAVLSLLGPEVYVSIDLDVLDPALMPAVGTPEPGGMDWGQVLFLLRGVAQRRRLVGFDVVELCPTAGHPACAYTAAKLAYKVMAYATLGSGRELTIPGPASRERAG